MNGGGETAEPGRRVAAQPAEAARGGRLLWFKGNLSVGHARFVPWGGSQ